jgi:hypothetical protein
MKIIITESQKQSSQDKLKKIVKELGWRQASDIIGGPENLSKLVFNNDPMEFLHLFNNMDIVQSEKKPNWLLYRHKKGENLMIYDGTIRDVYINYDKIWGCLVNVFNLKTIEIKILTETWLSEVYDLKGIRTGHLNGPSSISLI